MEKLVVRGIVDGAQRAHAVLDIGDRNVPERDAAQEIVRAVDRVDDPQALRIAGERRGRLLAEEMIAGKRARDFPANEILDLAVGDADEVLRALLLDRQRIAPMPEITGERAGLPVGGHPIERHDVGTEALDERAFRGGHVVGDVDRCRYSEDRRRTRDRSPVIAGRHRHDVGHATHEIRPRVGHGVFQIQHHAGGTRVEHLHDQLGLVGGAARRATRMCSSPSR